jgi:hypothetical protein
MSPNGTFYDYLAIGSPIPKSGTAYQEFTASGWFGTQPLDITGFGSLKTNGVNSNIFAPQTVTVNGMSGSERAMSFLKHSPSLGMVLLLIVGARAEQVPPFASSPEAGCC